MAQRELRPPEDSALQLRLRRRRRCRQGSAFDHAPHVAAEFVVLPGAGVAIAVDQHAGDERSQSGDRHVADRDHGCVAGPVNFPSRSVFLESSLESPQLGSRPIFNFGPWTFGPSRRRSQTLGSPKIASRVDVTRRTQKQRSQVGCRFPRKRSFFRRARLSWICGTI